MANSTVHMVQHFVLLHWLGSLYTCHVRALLTVVDGHAKAADGKEHGAHGAEEVELSEAGNVGQLGYDELDGAKNGNPGLQADAARLQQRSVCCRALWVVQPIYALQA